MGMHSIFFKLNALFVVTLVATLLAGTITVSHLLRRDRVELLTQSRLLIREYRSTQAKPVDLIREFDLIEIPKRAWHPVLKTFKKRRRALASHRRRSGAAHVIRYGEHLYLWIHTRHFKTLLRQRHSLGYKRARALVMFGGLVLLLGVMYLLLRRSLLPIRRLQRDIVRYGEGIFPDQERFSEGQDEIAQVGNAFYASAHKVQQMDRSRRLFVRNIFHELNTPVTQGKLLAELSEDPHTRRTLDRIFSRLASLLQELAQMERIVSRDVVWETRPVRVVDLVDQACDLLFLDAPVPTEVGDTVLEVDFALMGLAFKNLIDNALKHGADCRVFVENGAVVFASKGEKLPHPLSWYTEPFAAGEHSDGEGFGLGLYIVREIVEKHAMVLRYHYHDGENRFAIDYQQSKT